MQSLIKRNNFSLFDSDFDSLFENVFSSFFITSPGQKVQKTFVVTEENGAVILKYSLPGVDKEDLKLLVSEEGNLVIKWTLDGEERIETFGLDGLDPDTIKSSYKNGLLTITMKRPEKTNSVGREIDIK